MIRVPKLDGSGDHFHLVYDAWNRLVEVYADNGTTLIAQYQYDGTGRRIVKGVDDGTDGSLDTFTHYFHSGANQVIETREGEDVSGAAPAAESLEPKYQNIWSPRYVDSMILRDEYDSQGDIITANRVYYLSDANYNVTALVDASGNVIERYLYTPYGTVTVLDPDFSADADGESDCDNTTLYTGREFDPETELMYYRARYYHSELGRFVGRDPIGYWGGMTLYEYVDSRPILLIDPFGLAPPESNNDGDTGLSLSDRFKRFVDQLGTPSGSNGPSFGLPLTEALESGAPFGGWSPRWGIGFSESGGVGISAGSDGITFTGNVPLPGGGVMVTGGSGGTTVAGQTRVGDIVVDGSYGPDGLRIGGHTQIGDDIVIGGTYSPDDWQLGGHTRIGDIVIGGTYGPDDWQLGARTRIGNVIFDGTYGPEGLRIGGIVPVGRTIVQLSGCPEDWEILIGVPIKGGIISIGYGDDIGFQIQFDAWQLKWPFGSRNK